jgi:hypothetical protein
MDMAVLAWCKLFGSDDAERQPVHWKNVAIDQPSFRAALLAGLAIDDATWLAYWEEMKKYRDMEVAHHDLRRISIWTYPRLDHASNSGCYYFDYVRAELKKFGIDQQPGDIRRYARIFEEGCFEAATAAMNATSDMPHFG